MKSLVVLSVGLSFALTQAAHAAPVAVAQATINQDIPTGPISPYTVNNLGGYENCSLEIRAASDRVIKAGTVIKVSPGSDGSASSWSRKLSVGDYPGDTGVYTTEISMGEGDLSVRAFCLVANETYKSIAYNFLRIPSRAQLARLAAPYFTYSEGN